MVNTKLLAAIVIVIVIVAGSVGFLLLTSTPEVDSIKIGLIAPYGIPVGQDMDRAAKMAVDESMEEHGTVNYQWFALK